MHWFIVGMLLLLFGAVVFRGAPYVPSHRKTLEQTLELLELAPGETVLDLGSGDGAFLRLAARSGLKAVGYEINPMLVLTSMLRTLRDRKNIQIKVRDFWLMDWPHEVRGVYVFLVGPHMRHLQRKLEREMQHRVTPLKVVSNGFAIPGMMPKKIEHGLYLYELEPRK